jgi:hypothetical protein
MRCGDSALRPGPGAPSLPAPVPTWRRCSKGRVGTSQGGAARLHEQQAGPKGGHVCIMDAGKMQTVLQEAANGKRIPEWVLPDVSPALLSKMQPDILRIKGLRSNSVQTESNEALQTKAGLTIQVIELGYGPETRWRETLAKKRDMLGSRQPWRQPAGRWKSTSSS